MSRLKLFSKLGNITYGLYCLHFIGILVTTTIMAKLGFNKELLQVLGLETSIALLLSIVIAQISYHYFERPFLKFKRHYSQLPVIQVWSQKVK